jgi:hypothetical protein
VAGSSNGQSRSFLPGRTVMFYTQLTRESVCSLLFYCFVIGAQQILGVEFMACKCNLLDPDVIMSMAYYKNLQSLVV